MLKKEYFCEEYGLFFHGQSSTLRISSKFCCILMREFLTIFIFRHLIRYENCNLLSNLKMLIFVVKSVPQALVVKKYWKYRVTNVLLGWFLSSLKIRIYSDFRKVLIQSTGKSHDLKHVISFGLLVNMITQGTLIMFGVILSSMFHIIVKTQGVFGQKFYPFQPIGLFLGGWTPDLMPNGSF